MNGTRMVNEADLRVYLDKWDRKYWGTYKVGGAFIGCKDNGVQEICGAVEWMVTRSLL